VSFNQLMITSGIFVAYIADWALKGLQYNWRWMLGLGAIPGLALALGMGFLAPYSPRWLVEQDREEEAEQVLKRTREPAVTQALFVGLTNVVFTVVAVLLLDRIGRRPLPGFLLFLSLVGWIGREGTFWLYAGLGVLAVPFF
jgi:hypothetical protein